MVLIKGHHFHWTDVKTEAQSDLGHKRFLGMGASDVPCHMPQEKDQSPTWVLWAALFLQHQETRGMCMWGCACMSY